MSKPTDYSQSDLRAYLDEANAVSHGHVIAFDFPEFDQHDGISSFWLWKTVFARMGIYQTARILCERAYRPDRFIEIQQVLCNLMRRQA